jgi:hypothetical protein
MGAHAQRVNAEASPFWFGEVKSYDPATHKAVVTVDMGDYTYDTPPSQVLTSFWGAGYGDQTGPPRGAQAWVAVIDRASNLYLILGFTANNEEPGFNVPVDERRILDARGSFVWWTSVRNGALRLFGATIATLFAGVRVEIGAENLDTSACAVVRKADLDAALSAQVTRTKNEITAWAAAHLQGGTGASGPTLTAVTSTGSSKVTVAP